MSWQGVKLIWPTCLKHHQDEAGTLLDSDIPDMGRPADALPALPAQQDSNASPGFGEYKGGLKFQAFWIDTVPVQFQNFAKHW